MPGQPLVHERVVCRQQIEDVAVLAHDAVEEQFGFALKRLPQVVVEVGKQIGSRAPSSAGCAAAATGRRNSSPARRERGSASIRRTCRSSTAGVFSLPRARDVEQFLVRNAAPQEERQARRQLEVVEAIRRPGQPVRRIVLDTEHELRAGENPLQRALDARLRSSVAPARRGRNPSARFRSPSPTGCRYARRASVREDLSGTRSSSAAPAGRQTKMRRRLGVSPGPVTEYGR